MPHLDPSVLHDLASGEIDAAEQPHLLQHLKECAVCARELRELLTVYGLVAEHFQAHACPSSQMLADYAAGRLSGQELERVRQHVEGCAECRAAAQPFSEGALTKAAEPEEVVLAAAIKTGIELGREVAGGVLRQLMPDQVRLFDHLWGRVSAWLSHIGAADTILHRITGPTAVAGVLGFSDRDDPELLNAAIIVTTTAAVVRDVCAGRAARGDAAALARSIATQLGAGRALLARLPDAIMRDMP